MVSPSEIAQLALETVDAHADELVATSHAIHERPELAFEEQFAADLLSGALEAAGLDVERGAHGAETGFAARAGDGDGPHVAICCEYDALPAIGHACGHNVIAAAGLGAGFALAAAARRCGGRVTVLGTPAEERGGGKILMARGGAFDGVDVAMMIHPAGADFLAPTMLAMSQLDVRARGRSAHAAGVPWRGVNALDAVVMGYVAVGQLRQHIHPTERVHGIITRGGDAPNIVPETAAARYNIRSTSTERLRRLEQRVLACFEGAATAAGCTLDHRFLDPYEDLVTNEPLAQRYREHAERLGRTFLDPSQVTSAAVGSTDMGNVSKLVPSIHPMIAVAPPHVPLHSPEFTVHAASEAADRAVVEGAKAMALTAIDVWSDPDPLAAARSDHATGLQARTGSR